MSWVAVGSAVVGAGASLYGSSKANKAQKKGAGAAAAEQARQYDLTREDNLPALNARNNALERMAALANGFGSGPTMEQVMAEPGYQFGLKQGQNSLEGSAAARGGLYSGNTGKALQQYGNDYASTKYGEAWTRQRANQGDQYDRWRSLATGGQAGASTIAAAGQNAANVTSKLYDGMGNANANAAIANSNTYGGLANQLGSIYNNWNSQPKASPGLYQVGYGGNGAGGSPDGYYADGGPVAPSAPAPDPALMARLNERLDQLLAEQRMRQAGMGGRIAPTERVNLAEKKALGYADGGPVDEPVVGTKAPVRSGTSGGGLSRNAILMALMQQKEREKMRANPLNPRAVNAEREERANLADGGSVQGPGGPRDDAIPAQLSNGEHVMDAASVTAIGGGDNMLGQHKLNQLRALLRGM
jgi:hypothetical protein